MSASVCCALKLGMTSQVMKSAFGDQHVNVNWHARYHKLRLVSKRFNSVLKHHPQL